MSRNFLELFQNIKIKILLTLNIQINKRILVNYQILIILINNVNHQNK